MIGSIWACELGSILSPAGYLENHSLSFQSAVTDDHVRMQGLRHEWSPTVLRQPKYSIQVETRSVLAKYGDTVHFLFGMRQKRIHLVSELSGGVKFISLFLPDDKEILSCIQSHYSLFICFDSPL